MRTSALLVTMEPTRKTAKSDSRPPEQAPCCARPPPPQSQRKETPGVMLFRSPNSDPAFFLRQWTLRRRQSLNREIEPFFQISRRGIISSKFLLLMSPPPN